MAFKKLEVQNKSEYVYKQIIQAIEEGEYKSGDKLPVETEIAELLGVSRASVREALSALRLAGLIETKKGTGTYVTDVTKRSHLIFEDSKLSQINTFEMLEARRVAEPAVSLLAMENMTERDDIAMREALESMRVEFDNNNFDAFHLANKLFHSAILKASKNESLSNYIENLLNIFTNSQLGTEMRKRFLTERSYVEKAIGVHCAIYQAIADKDRAALYAAWEDHSKLVEYQLLGE